MDTAQLSTTTRPYSAGDAPEPPRSARLASLALAAMLTLATLAGIHTLAESEAAAPQMAQIVAPKG